MLDSSRAKIVAGVVVALAAVAVALPGAAFSAQSCGVYSAAGRSWIVVSNGVSCSSAKNVVRRLAPRTAALRSGQHVTVASPLRGFVCVLASRGKPGGSCSTAGAARSILWLVAN